MDWTCDIKKLTGTIRTAMHEAVEQALDRPDWGSSIYPPKWDNYDEPHIFTRPILSEWHSESGIPDDEHIKDRVESAVLSLRGGGAHPFEIVFAGINVTERPYSVNDEPQPRRMFLEAILVGTGIGMSTKKGFDPWGFLRIEDKGHLQEMFREFPIFAAKLQESDRGKT